MKKERGGVMDSSSVNLLWCMRMRHKRGEGASEHNHEFHHYIYVREGTGEVHINGERMELTAHHVYVFNPRVFHSFTAEEGLDLYEIKFEVKDSELAERLSCLASAVPVDPGEVERIFSSLVNENDEDDEWSHDYRNTLLTQFLLFLLRQSRRERENGRNGHQLLKIARYMRMHYGEELKNEDLAAQLHMEKTYFIKQFKQHFGIPPRKYLMTLRMECAADLIKNSDMNVSKIAELVGFKSIHHFSNAYKQYWGVGPSAYREKHTNK